MTTVQTPYAEYAEHLAYIQDQQAREAFVFMVEQAQTLSGYTAKPKPHGYIARNVHYFDANGTDSFAFNVSKHWLLFYLRHPLKTHPHLSAIDLRRLFVDAAQTKQGELNFRIRNVADAKQAMALVFGVADNLDAYSFPDEVLPPPVLLEGAVLSVVVNGYERNREAREACIRHYGYRCSVCDFQFDEMYGPLGKLFIHVHHLVALSSVRAEYQVDPVRDLRPVCPNCHAMLHRTSPPMSIQELREKLVRKPGSSPQANDAADA